MLAIIFKPNSLGSSFWVKNFFPMFVMKTGTSNMPFYHVVKIAFSISNNMPSCSGNM
jgi:hypothetical protein